MSTTSSRPVASPARTMSTYIRGNDSARSPSAVAIGWPLTRSSRTTYSASRRMGFDDCSASASTAGTSGTPARRNTASCREKRTRSIVPGRKNVGSSRWSASCCFGLRTARALGEEDIALHLVERGHVVRHLLERVEPHRSHPLGERLRADLIGGCTILQKGLHPRRQLEELEDADAIEEPGPGTARAPGAAGEHALLHAELAAERLERPRVRLLHVDAVWADLAHE